jgi:hypothetical protein
MITNKLIKKMEASRGFVDDAIEVMKQANSGTTVLDVGGGINSWCKNTTHTIDIFVNPGSKEEFIQKYPERTLFDFDITQRDNWKEVLDYVEENGKFDYSICSHVIEDILNASLVCDMLQKISKQGVILVPTKYAEHLRFENWFGAKGYRGYFHHKWIYTIKNNVLTGFEKANYWEHITDPRIERHLGRDTEICFMWEDDFEYKFYHVGEVVGCHCEAKYPLIFEIDDLFIP